MRKKLLLTVATGLLGSGLGLGLTAATASAALPPPPPSISQTAINALTSGYGAGTGGCYAVTAHNINTTGDYANSPIGSYIFQQVGSTLCPGIVEAP